jgi:hypothetical protein
MHKRACMRGPQAQQAHGCLDGWGSLPVCMQRVAGLANESSAACHNTCGLGREQGPPAIIIHVRSSNHRPRPHPRAVTCTGVLATGTTGLWLPTRVEVNRLVHMVASRPGQQQQEAACHNTCGLGREQGPPATIIHVRSSNHQAAPLCGGMHRGAGHRHNWPVAAYKSGDEPPCEHGGRQTLPYATSIARTVLSDGALQYIKYHLSIDHVHAAARCHSPCFDKPALDHHANAYACSCCLLELSHPRH